jgi:hypothetical protein
LIITPALLTEGFKDGPEIVKAGEAAALAALPIIQSWFRDHVNLGPEATFVERLPPASALPEGV